MLALAVAIGVDEWQWCPQSRVDRVLRSMLAWRCRGGAGDYLYRPGAVVRGEGPRLRGGEAAWQEAPGSPRLAAVAMLVLIRAPARCTPGCGRRCAELLSCLPVVSCSWVSEEACRTPWHLL